MKGATVMKKAKVIIVLILVVCMTVSICACGGAKSKVVGNWVCDEVHGDYPDQITLNRDGTGTGDGFSLNWSIQDDTITFNVGMIGTYTYYYEVYDSKLYLDGYGYTRQ